MGDSHPTISDLETGRHRAGGLLARTRLFAVIDQALGRPVVWVWGPPGAGKTTLLSTYLSGRKLPAVFYTAPGPGTGPDQVLSGWEDSLQRQWPHHPPDSDIPRADRIAALCSATQRPFFLVLDDAHHATTSTFLLIARAVRSVLPGVHFIFLSRSAPGPEMTRLRRNKRLATVGWGHLRLTSNEARKITRGRAGTPLSLTQIDQMHATSGGWAAGFFFLLNTALRGNPVFNGESLGRRYLDSRFRSENMVASAGAPPGDGLLPVRIRTLGRFDLLLEGRPVTFSRRPPKRPLELLKILIGVGPQGRPETEVADLLWPTADGDAAIRNLATALHRLRLLLDGPNHVIRGYGWLRLNPGSVWVDAWALNRCGTGDTGHDPGLAVALYDGPFLVADEPAPWLLAARERYREAFLRCVLRDAERWRKQGDGDTAITRVRQAMVTDPLIIPLYRSRGKTHREGGRRGDNTIDAVWQRARSGTGGQPP